MKVNMLTQLFEEGRWGYVVFENGRLMISSGDTLYNIHKEDLDDVSLDDEVSFESEFVGQKLYAKNILQDYDKSKLRNGTITLIMRSSRSPSVGMLQIKADNSRTYEYQTSEAPSTRDIEIFTNAKEGDRITFLPNEPDFKVLSLIPYKKSKDVLPHKFHPLNKRIDLE